MVETSAADPYVDPRAVRTRRVVLEAAAAIIATDGAGAITHQRVAEHAGVGRATLYRHWPTAADLLYDAMGEVDEPLFRRPTGPLKGWLRRELERVAVDIGQPNSVQFLAFLVSRSPMEPAAAAFRGNLIERSVAPLAAALNSAVESGELARSPDADDLLARLLGPLLFRVVHEGRRATNEFIDSVIEQALAPYA